MHQRLLFALTYSDRWFVSLIVTNMSFTILFALISSIPFLLSLLRHSVFTTKQLKAWNAVFTGLIAIGICLSFVIMSAFSYLHYSLSLLMIAVTLIGSIVHLIRDTSIVDDVMRHNAETNETTDIPSETSHLLSTTRQQAAAKVVRNYVADSGDVVSTIWNYGLSLIYGIVKRPVVIIAVVFTCTVFSAVLVYSTCNVCLMDHPITVSTSYSRISLEYTEYLCRWETICYMYFTVPRDMSTSMIVNFQIRSFNPVSTFVFYTDEHNVTRNTIANCFYMDENPDHHRYQCWSDLVDLTPDHSYTVSLYVAVTDLERNWHTLDSPTKRFRTGPSVNSSDAIRFVEGGDVQWNHIGIELAKAAAESNPHFALVAGDIFYANGMPSCYPRIDQWFYYWDKYMMTADNHSIPILTAIGNHEAGGFLKSRKKVGFYFRHFPHELGLITVDPNHRLPYHEHVFSNHTYIVILDSYVIASETKDQLIWLNHTLSTSPKPQHTNRLAAYHVSAYPIDPNEIPDITKDVRNNFTPLFDKHKFKGVFENHYHVLAQTKPMKAGTIAENNDGIIYFGQGAWGVLYNYPASFQVPSYIDQYEPVCHIFTVTCSLNCQVSTVAYQNDAVTVLRTTTI